jgi:sigma-B regulation protein RsbU (phosphoserine phosphatase)
LTPLDLQRNRYARGPDRRVASRAVSTERRRSTHDRRNNALEWLSLFRGTDLQAVASAIGHCEVIVVPAGTALLRPGEANDTVYVLMAGRVAAYLDDRADDENAIVIHPGECVGELSAIDGKPPSALVLAQTDARLLVLPRELFWSRLMAMPAVGRNLLVSLAERMRRSNESMLEAQRKRLELKYLQQELDVARQLQAGMLPLRRPLFPERTDVEIAGVMQPASSIGGDLFDAFFVDDGRLFFCVGDVSGHGVPAALFMARAIGLMHIAAMSTDRPERLLERINDELCVGNDGSMFITVFCGFFEVESGRLVYSNAGHCPPAFVRRTGATRLPLPKGTLAGVVSGMRYEARETVLAPGDLLVCYTDGVIEAKNATAEEFTDVRLLDAVTRTAGECVEAVLDALKSEVMRFSGRETFEDDFTLLALRRPLASRMTDLRSAKT